MTWKLTDRSLCQISGISCEGERRYHADGVSNTGALITHLAAHGRNSLLKRVLSSARMFQEARRLEMLDVIVNSFPVGVRSRVVADRYEKTLFFDVETNGCGPCARITSIGTSMNGVERVFVRGVDLEGFLSAWNEAEIIVSFNGKRFDVPVLMHEFGISRIPAHVDLLDEARRYGLRGGLKAIERRIGFQRPPLACRDGHEAVEMWKQYEQGDGPEFLETLKAYNLEDVRSLVALFRYLLPLSIEGII